MVKTSQLFSGLLTLLFSSLSIVAVGSLELRCHGDNVC